MIHTFVHRTYSRTTLLNHNLIIVMPHPRHNIIHVSDLADKCRRTILASGVITVPSSRHHPQCSPPPLRRRLRLRHVPAVCYNWTIDDNNNTNIIPKQHHVPTQQHRAFTTQSPSSSYFSSAVRSSSINSFFQQIETNYGNLSSLFDTGKPGETIVVEDGIIHPHHLVRLVTHEATALHIRNFYNRDCAKRLGRELLMMNDESQQYPQHQQQSAMGGSFGGGGGSGGNARKNWKINTPRGLESSDVMTVGEHMPYNVAYSSSVAMGGRNRKEDGGGGLGGTTSNSSSENQCSSLIDDYFEGVQREFRLRRQPKKVINEYSSYSDDHEHQCYHPLWPLDKLRLELEEAWPSGAGLAREGEQTKQRMTTAKRKDITNESNVRYPRPYGGGLTRIMQGPTRWKRGFIHVDELGPLDDTRGLFSANIYLTVPEAFSAGSIDCSSDDEGWKKDAGALHVWPLGVRSRWDWYRVSRNTAVYDVMSVNTNTHVILLSYLERRNLVQFVISRS